ncbi:hypothetical protein J2S58_002085 [Nakamurella flavida]|uniref:hypothetical protein n=1 Tax=Nakamurella flavida TaxID=363630 RepID=UPI0027803BA8|nr:hypothetical protein [Nakamurella flavida]MDP9778462.1 hypothetical protein [Nakamurella flavida]
MRAHGAAAGPEDDHLRIGRRQFLSWGAGVTAALAVAVVLPTDTRAAVGFSAAGLSTPTEVTIDLNRLDVLFGTPSDVARAAEGQVWALDTDGVMMAYDRSRRTWRADRLCSFPPGSKAHAARWGHPGGSRQMLMVIFHDA